jgi:RHS repeat-associated protein
MSARTSLWLRARVVLAAIVMTATGVIVQAAPALPVARPAALAPQTAQALGCASNATFTGKLTQQLVNSGTPTTAARITTATVHGWISNVDTAWSCTAAFRYDGVGYNTTTSLGTFDWGPIILSSTVACNWVVGSTDYVKANSSTSTCPATDTSAAMSITLGGQGVYQADSAHNTVGDFSFIHSDCTSSYTGFKHITSQSFATTDTGNRPGANCDPLTIDGQTTPQTITFDSTAPAIAFDAPAAGGPVVVPSAFYTVQFDATDNLADFGGANGWTLQRQVATWSGGACGTFANDGAAVTGTTDAANQLSGQSLLVDRCYRWTLDATDQNGNSPAAITSGSIRTDTSGVLGLQGHLRTEGWDLGAGDSLAVSPGSGNVVIDHPVVSLPIRGSSTSIGLVYNSQDAGNVGFGPGWRLNVQRRLAIDAGTGNVTFTDGDGSRHTFTSPVTVGSVTTYTRPSTLYATLVKDTSISTNEFVLTYRDLGQDKFDILGTEGLLVRAQDRFANGVTLAYVAGTNRISTIIDTAGSRTIDFGYDGSNRLTSITDWAYVSGGVVQTTATGSRRATRFFYDGSSNLSGWADGLNTAGSCPTSGSHLTCLTLSAGLVSSIGKTQTVETLSAGVLGSATRTISTAITYSGSDVTTVKDAEEVAAGSAGTAFSHLNPAQTQVVRRGNGAASLDTSTRYTLASATDPYGRITSVKRKFGATWIEQLTAYDATYPIERAAITENNGALLSTPARTTSWTYVASSLGLVLQMTEPLTASTNRTTDFTYNANNDVTQKIVALDGSATIRTITRYCYDGSCTTSGASTLTMSKQIDSYVDGTAGNGVANVDDFTTTFQYDAYGQVTRETRSNYNAAGTLLDSRATGHTYDGLGNLTSDIANYVSGTVTSPGDDITPNATTNARTDLTTAPTFDTAGNQVSTADPRRAIESAKGTSLGTDDFIIRSTFDALGQALTTRQPTTLAISDCSPSPACRTMTSVFDELGSVREATDPGGVVSATEVNRVDHGTRTFEDTDGVGATAAAVTSTMTFDASGRILTTKDRRQSADATLGSTSQTYDELGRTTDTTAASGSSPDVASTAHQVFDALDRQTAETAGSGGSAAQTTTTTFDLGGRAVSIDDEFTCMTSTYDYRDLATQMVQGLASGTCSGGAPVTTTITNDALGRVTLRHVDASNDPEASTFDAAGNALVMSGKQAGTTTTSTYTINPLDQAVVETRTDGSTAKTNYDAAGNATDRCYWKPSITVGSCLPANTVSWTNSPTQAGTSGYDARNQKVTLISRLGSSSTVATTTYDPAHNYQISAFYLPTTSGKEAQDLYGYDSRHRVTLITHQLCTISSGHACSSTAATGSSSYAYDDNNNRTTVTESSTSAAATTRTYCYDALNRLTASKATTACTSSPDETNVYDDAGNRTSATAAGSTRTFTYGSDGQLDSCTVPACTISYDAAGRSATITDNGVSWTFSYDADGRVISACKSTACSGSIDRVDYLYDGSGHRIQIKETTSGAVVSTTDLRYQGDTIVQELVGGTVTRTYATDDTGRIVEVCDPDCATGTIYVVVYNGHGDATGLWKQETSGALTLVNSYTYSTWGSPTTTVVGGFSDLKFRFLYVGGSDVQWDSSFGLNLHYMHARHYSPALARFIQPDPSGAESNAYAYAGGNPIVRVDPTGLESWAPNPLETLWCLFHPFQCPIWAWSSTQAIALSRLKYHSDIRIENAIRHCVWQCLLTYRLGWYAAQKWGWAHEVGGSEYHPNDRQVDYHNNYVGRLLGEHMNEISGIIPASGRALRLCEGAWNWGYLWYINRDGTFHMSDGRTISRARAYEAGENRP